MEPDRDAPGPGVEADDIITVQAEDTDPAIEIEPESAQPGVEAEEIVTVQAEDTHPSLEVDPYLEDEPEPVAWTPQTVGWAVAAVWLLMVVILVARRTYLHWRRNRYRRAALAELVGEAKAVPPLEETADRMVRAARERLFAADAGVFVSGPDRQVSQASQAWMVLGGVVEEEAAREVLQAVLSREDAVPPKAPYLVHYVVEALFASGLDREAAMLIARYSPQERDLVSTLAAD